MSPAHVAPGESAAEAALHALRRRIIAGELPPGERLVDAVVAEQHGVSRNTARDALRLLAAEGLAVSVRNVGYSVRALAIDDIRDLYAARRIIESGSVLQSHAASEDLLADIDAAVTRTERSVRGGDWSSVGTGSLAFHQAIVRLAGSPSLERAFDVIAAQLRLAFAVIPDEGAFQVRWIARDREIAELVVSGARAEAAKALAAYLDDSEASVIDALRAAERQRARAGEEPADEAPAGPGLPSIGEAEARPGSPVGADAPTGADPSPHSAAAQRGAAAPKGHHD